MTDQQNTGSFDYLSTTIPYVNGAPHVGFALELVQTDALARYARLTERELRTSTGSDDHSLKNLRAAALSGEPVSVFVQRKARDFRELAQLLDARFDEFVATSCDARHPGSVARLLAACAANGDLYRKRYRGAYCVGCEQFYRPQELTSGGCPEHGAVIEEIEEENWFFRLSRYQQPLAEAIASDRLRVLPTERKNEVLGFIRGGLEDFSVSRSRERARDFGIPFPGDASQVTYVWVDALCNYLTAGNFAALGAESDWERAGRRVHVLGKGVLRFHAVYWPALLASAGLRLPDELRVHGYLTVDGKKIGKSAGNGVDPRELVRAVGPDALRYYLLRHISPFKDADFSRQRLLALHDSELADELGNLALRVLTLAQRVPELTAHRLATLTDAESALEERARSLAERLERAFAEHELASAAGDVWELVRATNRYIDRCEPWRLAKRSADRARLVTVLAAALAALRLLARALSPFIPALAARLAEAVGGDIEPGALTQTSLIAHGFATAPLPFPRPLVARLL